jgi:hypothetical protein
MANELLPFSVGVEIEINSLPVGDTYTRVCNALNEKGLNATVSGDHLATASGKWLVKHDGSCGNEIVSPILWTEEDLQKIKTVCTTLRTLGAATDNRCGLHVHIGWGVPQHDVQVHTSPDGLTTTQTVSHSLKRFGKRGSEAERIFRFFSRYQEVFFMLAAAHRSDNRYCRRFSDKLRQQIRTNLEEADLFRTDRYTWLNGNAISRHGTIEFRLMEGTLDADLILGWINLLLTCFDTIVNGGRRIQWGTGAARSKRMLFLTGLQQAGCYGKAMRDPVRAEKAREWALERFKQLHPEDMAL